MQQFLFVIGATSGRATIDEERFIHFLAVDGNGRVLLRIRRHAAAVFEAIFVGEGLVGIPNAAIAIHGLQLASCLGQARGPAWSGGSVSR